MIALGAFIEFFTGERIAHTPEYTKKSSACPMYPYMLLMIALWYLLRFFLERIADTHEHKKK